ncbi:hypothetical protein B0H19DRAFT_1056869 [Mycena capillaripes]|nr:hypothetical protein B0H19DRAFT_1056869 [Mycena capillaripes]
MICEEVKRADLLILCLISRRFLDQIQHIIYRTVDLRCCGPRALKSWCLAVTRRPQLAERVHALWLTLSGDLSLSSDAAKLARALSKCVNLKELTVHHAASSEGGGGGFKFDSFQSWTTGGFKSDSIQSWIINKCPFRLTKFSNSYFRNSFLSHFWSSQSDIRILSLPSCRNFPWDDIQLPNLIAVEVDICALPADRELQLELITKVARELPALRHFGMTEVAESHRQIVEHSPHAALAKFARLETLVLYTRSIAAFREVTPNLICELGTPGNMKTIGLAIMAGCPTLHQIALGAQIYPPLNVDVRYREGSELTCTLMRTTDGEIQLQDGTRFDFQAVSMFWNA